ncbi:MAG: hypothetical protein L6R39_002348 [Caloplaca ligustica]|nr:MAG: hypothetical protein L6R39_002348 [Caloplaca ligustica]
MQPEPGNRHTSIGLESMANNPSSRRAKARSRPENLSFNALPDFSFHPSPSSNETPASTTPSSPSKSQTIPQNHGGHRRNGNEFIGGDGRNAVTGLMSSSPTKGEGALPPPPGVRSGAPVGRRGHAHRRSGAISSHDVSTMLKPTESRGGSAPSTPSDPLIQPILPPFLDRSISQPTTVPTSKDCPPLSFHHRQASSGAGQTRPRVGFSDHVEFIPRPLSTISSETSSSLSTLRPSHSVTGSISSVISNANTSPPSAKSARIPNVDVVQQEEILLDSSIVQGKEGIRAGGPSNAQTVLGTSCDSPAWSEVFKSPRSELDTSHSDFSDDATNMLRLSGTPDALRSRRRPASSVHSPIARPRTSPEPKVSKRQRKVKSWAGSFLARKARNSLHEGISEDRGSPAPRPSPPAAPEDLAFEQLNFDEDTTCVVDTAPPQAFKPSPVQVESPSFRARGSSLDSDSDESSQILDLDALCAPAATSPSFEEITGSRGAGVRRRMHSSGATGGFDGPGMHYHRRAESAPELAPINRRIFGSAGLTSSTAMADVFEEDEEDETVNQQKDVNLPVPEPTSEEKEEQAHGLGVRVADVNPSNNTGSPDGRPPCIVAGPFSKNEPSNLRTSSATSSTPTATPDDFEPVEIVSADEEPREAVALKYSNELAMTPTLASDPFIARPASAPMQYTFPTPIAPFATPETYSSAMSTPNFSQTSFEGPRLHTATSSITDRGTLSSFRAGDQGFDLRSSVDDVPSLTSSASTTASGYPPRISSSAPTFSSADRPPSLTAVIAPRTRPGNASKRSSLASLSRLVGGSHGEKSKLNIEECAQQDAMEKSEKKKGRRISRLMRFWKSKEKVTSA